MHNDTDTFGQTPREVMELSLAQFHASTEQQGLYVAYIDAVRSLSIYPKGVAYPTLGLMGEFGEFLHSTDLREAGDMIWYIGALCIEYSLSPNMVFQVIQMQKDNDWAAILTIGKICETSKKVLRDKGGIPDKADQELMLDYLRTLVSYLRNRLSARFEDVLRENVEKLYDRKARSVLSGNGDNR